MDLQMNGKVAIVTGASRGIGRSIAQVLAAEGMRLVMVARSKDQLDEVAVSCPLSGYCQGSIIDVDGGQTRTL